MTVTARNILFLFLAISLVFCKSKKKSLSGDEPVEVSDFISFFPPAQLPWQVSDTVVLKKQNDSLLISYNVLTQFVPDSILTRIAGKNTKPKLYPLARIESKAETYLFAKLVSGEKHMAVVFGFDKNEEFAAVMPLLQVDNSAATQQLASIDNRFSIYKTTLRKNTDGTVSEGKDVYVLNTEARNFMLIMTEALDDKTTELTNPIDTFSRKQKFTADYGSGKMNLLSIRDGRKSDRLTFFIHFEKNNGQCTGELKGEAILKTPVLAEYREPGESCVLQFSFSSSGVTVKEMEACGSKRGLRCSFNGNYPRKKEIKPKAVKTKKSS